ncbi:hypothetical protein M728_004732 (plasmid) [Ensifer sp. WSM1721]
MGEGVMPAKSKAQQMAAGAALAAKRGEKKKSELKDASRSMAESMTEKELEEMASTKRKGKKQHVSKK